MAGNENDDKWYLTKKEIEENSPSRRDGVSVQKENRLRKKFSRFISETCQKLQIPKVVIATATLFCHRFFLQRSLAKHAWHRIAIACVFLASKVEEHRIRMATFKKEGWRESFKKVFKNDLPFKAHRKMILQDERNILAAINFEISVDHPHKYFVKAVRKIKEVPAEVCRAATEFMDNSYFSSLCLQFKPHKIAGAAFHLSYKFLKLKLPFQEEEGYSVFFQMTLNELEDISSQMMDLYEYRPPPNPAPDNQSASSSSSSSLPVDQSLSASASTSASPPPAGPSKKGLTVLIPRPPAPGKQSLTELMPPPPPPARAKQSLPGSSNPPAAPSNQNPPKPAAKTKVRVKYPPKPPKPAVPGNEMRSGPAALCIQIPPPSAVTLQSPAEPSHQSLSQPAADPKQNSPASSPTAAALGSQNPPVLPAPVAPGNQSPKVRQPLTTASGDKSPPKTGICQYYRRKPRQPAKGGKQSPPPSAVTLQSPDAPSHQSLSQPAADPKQNSPATSPSAAAPGSQNPPLLPAPVAPGNQNPKVRPPLTTASGDESPPGTGIGQYYRRKRRQPAKRGKQSPPPSVAPSNQSPPRTSSPPAAPTKQSPSGPPP